MGVQPATIGLIYALGGVRGLLGAVLVVTFGISPLGFLIGGLLGGWIGLWPTLLLAGLG